MRIQQRCWNDILDMSATTRTFQIFKANHILLHIARSCPQKLYISLKVDGNFNLMINSAWIYVSNNLRLRPWKLVQKDLSRVWMISFLCLSSLSLSTFRNFIQSWVVWKEKNPNIFICLASITNWGNLNLICFYSRTSWLELSDHWYLNCSFVFLPVVSPL